MSDENEPETEPEEESGGCAGAVVVIVLMTAAIGILWSLSPELFVIGMWVIGWGALVWHAKRVPPTANPAPPPPPEGVAEEEPQVALVPDPSHRNRWLVVRPSRWLDKPTDKDGTT